jgi:hypothetical protein
MSKKPGTPATPKSRTLIVQPTRPAGTQEEHIAALLADGVATNASTVIRFAKAEHGDIDLTALYGALRDSGQSVQRGDLSGIESVLTAQIAALNAIFGEMARRAALNMGEYLDATDKYLKLAMRAQSQCRATAETLAVIKAGPPVFARQANIANGPQQVNNGTIPPATRAGENTSFEQPELLGSSDGLRLDTGTAGTAGRSDSAMEAVGTKHRAEDAGRQV